MPARIPAGTLGRITVAPVAGREGKGNAFRATARYGDHDGTSRTVQAFGKTKAAAERALKAKANERAPRTSHEIQASAPLREAAEFWYSYEVDRRKLSDGSLTTYRQSLDSLARTSLWSVPLHEIDTPTLDRFLNDLALESEARAKRLRVVLGQTFTLAVRRGAIKHNPVRDTELDLRATDDREPEIFTPEELARIRRAAHAYMNPNGPGRRPTLRIDVIIDVMIGAGGLRPGEALALLWEETDLGNEPTTRVTGTIKTVSAHARLGFTGTYRKPRPKTKKSRRQLLLDTRSAEALRRMPKQESGLIFATADGKPISRRNLTRSWAKVREIAGLPDAKLKMFRATVATLVDDAFDTRTASRLLGHAAEQVTRDSYIRRPELAPDVRRILDELP